MCTSQKHQGLSLRQWRSFLFCLLAGHWVDSADHLREAQVRRQGGFTQRNLSFHPSEEKTPTQCWFCNPAPDWQEVCTTLHLFGCCYKSKSQHFVFLFFEVCSGCRCPGAARWPLWGGAGITLCQTGMVPDSPEQGTAEPTAQLFPQGKHG